MRKLFLCFMILILTNLTFAELYVDVSNPSPTRQQSFNLEVTFINANKDRYEIKGIENFDILSKATKTSYSYINGNKTALKTDMYTLRAKKTGHLTLDIITNTGENKSVDLFVETKNNNTMSKKTEEKTDEKFVLKTDLLEKKYYFGEKIPFEEYFISTVNISSFSVVEMPKFNDFSVKNITPYKDKNYIQNTITYKGKQAFELVLFKGIIQANSSGKKTIMSSELKIGEASRGFFNETVSFLGPKILSLDIVPLPLNSPENFKDIVGSLMAEEKWNRKDAEVGEAITLNLKLYGSGNLELLDKLNLKNTESYNIFENIKNYDEKIEKNRYYNEKTFEIAIVPKKEGVLKTPEISIPYFNTTTKKYEILRVASREIKVSGQTVEEPTKNIEEVDKTSVKKAEDTKLDKINVEVIKESKKPIKNIYKLAFVITSFIALIELIIIIYLVMRKKNEDI